MAGRQERRGQNTVFHAGNAELRGGAAFRPQLLRSHCRPRDRRRKANSPPTGLPRRRSHSLREWAWGRNAQNTNHRTHDAKSLTGWVVFPGVVDPSALSQRERGSWLMSLLEESLFFYSEASVSVDCEAGSGPTTRSLRSPRSLREKCPLPSCPWAGGGLCDLCELCVIMPSAFVWVGDLLWGLRSFCPIP